MSKEKNPAAVALGRLGGKAKTDKPKGLAAMSEKQRKKITSQGGIAKAKKQREKESNQ